MTNHSPIAYYVCDRCGWIAARDDAEQVPKRCARCGSRHAWQHGPFGDRSQAEMISRDIEGGPINDVA